VLPLVLLRLIFSLESFCCRAVARPSKISVSSRRFGRLWIFTGPIHSSARGLLSLSIRGRVSSVSRFGLCAPPVSFAALAFSLPLTILPPLEFFLGAACLVPHCPSSVRSEARAQPALPKPKATPCYFSRRLWSLIFVIACDFAWTPS
jgi:hypothetical protein